eukprot:5646558-Lingulodinium_polyedra.AAC.1
MNPLKQKEAEQFMPKEVWCGDVYFWAAFAEDVTIYIWNFDSSIEADVLLRWAEQQGAIFGNDKFVDVLEFPNAAMISKSPHVVSKKCTKLDAKT